MGISDANECPQLCKLANNYLRKTKGCEEEIYAYFASEADAESLHVKLMDEFDQCILSYFAFHWSHASLMITQVKIHNLSKKIINRILKFQHIPKSMADLMIGFGC